jgi:hypothetical protein
MPDLISISKKSKSKAMRINLLSIVLLTLAALTSSAFHQQEPEIKSTLPRMNGGIVFLPGEVLTYRVHYGFINAGEAVLKVGEKVERARNNRPAYRIEAVGRSTGAFSRFMPAFAYRYVEENKYRLKEEASFDYARKQVLVKNSSRPDSLIPISDPIQDMVSGYYNLRQVDYSNLHNGDVLDINAYFDSKLYRFRIRFVGKETIKTKWGRVRTLVLSPIMPENSLFNGENSIRLWMSDDRNRIPLKVKAELFVGAVELDLSSYSGTRVPLETAR